MHAGAITEKDFQLVKKLKKARALMPISGWVPKLTGVICLMCNSGEQAVDRLVFMKEHIAEDVHPVMTHGGAIRVDSNTNFFDENALAGVKKAFMAKRYQHHVLEGHHPCLDAAIRGLSLSQVLCHTAYSKDTFLRFMHTHFVPIWEVMLTFHIDWRSFGKVQKHPMETFMVNPVRTLEVLCS